MCTTTPSKAAFNSLNIADFPVPLDFDRWKNDCARYTTTYPVHRKVRSVLASNDATETEATVFVDLKGNSIVFWRFQQLQCSFVNIYRFFAIVIEQNEKRTKLLSCNEIRQIIMKLRDICVKCQRFQHVMNSVFVAECRVAVFELYLISSDE